MVEFRQDTRWRSRPPSGSCRRPMRFTCDVERIWSFPIKILVLFVRLGLLRPRRLKLLMLYRYFVSSC
jgi:hypothetical protein